MRGDLGGGRRAKKRGLEEGRAWETFFFSSRRRHTKLVSDWSSDVCSSDPTNMWMRLEMPTALSVGATTPQILQLEGNGKRRKTDPQTTPEANDGMTKVRGRM